VEQCLAVTGGVMIALGRMNKILRLIIETAVLWLRQDASMPGSTNAVKARGFLNAPDPSSQPHARLVQCAMNSADRTRSNLASRPITCSALK